MSSGGRWRLALNVARTTGTVLVLGALVWGGWHVVGALRANAKTMPAAAKAAPIKRVELHTATGGALDDAWLVRTLALPKGISLVELDLERVRERVLADGQVVSVTMTKQFPDTLRVQVTERTPVARIKVGTGTAEQVYLVARDGVVYLGTNYDRGMLDTLPWLAGFSLKPQGAGFQPIRDMAVVADLLATAQYEATHLYMNWQIVSLDRLELDREIDVTTKNGSRVTFTSKTDFLPQLAKLDKILENLRDPARFPGARQARVRIDLSLGSEVPVMLEPVAAANGAAVYAPTSVPERPVLAPGFNVFPSSSSRKQQLYPREL